MAILKVARMGHPILRRVADLVPPEDIPGPEIQQLIEDMLDTVLEYEGAGLAAPQVHVSRRVVVLQLDAGQDFQVWINPVLQPTTEDKVASFEGCLSVPDLRGMVARPGGVTVKALNPVGAPIHLQLEGFPAVVAQHECDHLDGILYVDKVIPETLSFLEEFRRFGHLPHEGPGDDLEDDLDESQSEDEAATQNGDGI